MKPLLFLLIIGLRCIAAQSIRSSIRNFTGHASSINGLALYGQNLFSSSLDQSVRKWSILNGSQTGIYTYTLQDQGGAPTSIYFSSVSISVDGSIVYAGDHNHGLALSWMTANQSFSLMFNVSIVGAYSWSSGGLSQVQAVNPLLFTLAPSGLVVVFYLTNATAYTSESSFPIPMYMLARSDASVYYVGGITNFGTPLPNQILGYAVTNASVVQAFNITSGTVFYIAMNGNQTLLSAALIEGYASVWSTVNFTCVFTVTTNGPIFSVALSPSGAELYAAGQASSYNILAWFLPNGSTVDPPVSFAGHANQVTNLEISSNGDFLYSADTDGLIYQWNAPIQTITTTSSTTTTSTSSTTPTSLAVETSAFSNPTSVTSPTSAPGTSDTSSSVAIGAAIGGGIGGVFVMIAAIFVITGNRKNVPKRAITDMMTDHETELPNSNELSNYLPPNL